MDINAFILISAILVGLYSAINIGANDVANSMATSVASKALTIKKAVVVILYNSVISQIFFYSGCWLLFWAQHSG